MKRLLFLLILFLGTTKGALAEIGFELYSWQEKAGWNYAIFEGTSTVRSDRSVRARQHRLKGIHFLKGRIASLPSGESVYWRENSKRGFLLPPREILREIEQFAASSQVTLFLPGETRDSKTLKNLQGEAREMLDLGQ